MPGGRRDDGPVRFAAEHRFRAPVDAVAALLLDPDFHRTLDLPDMAVIDVVATGADGESVLRVRYRFVGQLDPIARRLLGRRELTWAQELRLDPATGTGWLSFAADADPRRLHGAADVALEALDGGTLRRIEGELTVAVPLLGGRAEGHILPGLLRRLDIEAAAVEQRLGAT